MFFMFHVYCLSRLYCDGAESVGRLSGLATCHDLCLALLTALAPVLPHLTEEASLAHPTALPSPTQHGWVKSADFRNDILSQRRVSFFLHLWVIAEHTKLAFTRKTDDSCLLFNCCEHGQILQQIGIRKFVQFFLYFRIPFLEQIRESVKKLGLKSGEGSLLIKVKSVFRIWIRTDPHKEMPPGYGSGSRR